MAQNTQILKVNKKKEIEKHILKLLFWILPSPNFLYLSCSKVLK